jgi:membrane-bound metal-dependent hydrolase YbcI (DUF457 family)
MPLVGHAFVGAATAWSVPPQGKEPTSGRSAGFWLSALVGLAYLPDIVGHALALVGVSHGRVIAHSVLFAVVASLVFVPLVVRVFRAGPVRASAVVFGSILGHDLLDLLQGSDRMPLWPFLKERVRLPFAIIPSHAIEEAFFFLVAFVVFVLVWGWLRGGPAVPRWSWDAWPGVALAGLVLSAAVLTYGAKLLHEREEDRVEECLAQHRYAEALTHLDHLRLWTNVTRSGDVDRLTARALLGIGDRDGAERHLLAAEQAEPDDYRTLVDLAFFYASSDRAPAEREARVAPYRDRLERDFARRRSLPRVLTRLEERLAAPGPPTRAGTND